MKSSNEKLKKTALFSLIGAGAGSLLFIPWGMSRSHENTVEEPTIDISENLSTKSIAQELSDFEQAFATARAKQGSSQVFEFNERLFSTYYKEEWDNMDIEEKHAFLNQIRQVESDMGFAHSVPVAGNVIEDMHPEDAFMIARAEVGVGGVFILHNTLYSTYTQEEINNLSSEEYKAYFSALSNTDLNVPVHDINDIHVMDVHLKDSFQENYLWNLDVSSEALKYHEEIIDNIGVIEEMPIIPNQRDTPFDNYHDYPSETIRESDLEIVSYDSQTDVVES
ncbi:MAG: hypothetical protein LBH22_06465 [Bacteroidales bacterium]|jgi:hypothetical protein|nr:hypothetical protein [Bacteroidales bacterium]